MLPRVPRSFQCSGALGNSLVTRGDEGVDERVVPRTTHPGVPLAEVPRVVEQRLVVGADEAVAVGGDDEVDVVRTTSEAPQRHLDGIIDGQEHAAGVPWVTAVPLDHPCHRRVWTIGSISSRWSPSSR